MALKAIQPRNAYHYVHKTGENNPGNSMASFLEYEPSKMSFESPKKNPVNCVQASPK